MSGYVDKHTYSQTVRRNIKLREELAHTGKELATLEGRYRVAIADVATQRGGKTAKTLAIAEHMLSDCIRLAHELEENRGTKGVARRLRSILGLPPVKQEGEELETKELARDSIDARGGGDV